MPAEKPPKKHAIYLPDWLNSAKITALFEEMNEDPNACFASIISDCLQNNITDDHAVAGVVQNFLLAYQDNVYVKTQNEVDYFSLFTDGSLKEAVIVGLLEAKKAKTKTETDLLGFVDYIFFNLRANLREFTPVSEDVIMAKKPAVQEVQGVQFVTATFEEVRMPEPVTVERVELTQNKGPKVATLEPMQPQAQKLVPFEGPVLHHAEVRPGKAAPAEKDFDVQWPAEEVAAGKLELAKCLQNAKKEIVGLFNDEAKKGIKKGIAKIKEICEKNGIKDVEPQIAAFFSATDENTINREKIGDYLSEKVPENEKVLACFVGNMDFANLSFSEALRKFLKTVVLPVEAQKIDRLVNSFGIAYKQQNPNTPVATPDASYILAFNLIMLNTGLHNPEVKRKITEDEFIKNSRGTNDGKDYDKEFLSGLYSDIKKNQFTLNVTQNIPGYVLASFPNKKQEDPMFMALAKQINSQKNDEIKKILGLPLDDKYKVTIKKPSFFTSLLFGSKGTIIIKGADNKAVATLELSTPGLFTKIFGDKGSKNRVLIQPICPKAEFAIQEHNLAVAAKLAAHFTESHLESINATYDYERNALKGAFDKEKVLVLKSSSITPGLEQANSAKHSTRSIDADNPKPPRPER